MSTSDQHIVSSFDGDLEALQAHLIRLSALVETALVAAANPARFPDAASADACRPNALVLLYPWKVADGGAVRSDVTLDARMPPTFILQTADDKASSPDGAALLYRRARQMERNCPNCHAEYELISAAGDGPNASYDVLACLFCVNTSTRVHGTQSELACNCESRPLAFGSVSAQIQCKRC